MQENGEMGATRLGSCHVWEEGTAVGSVGRLFVMSKEGVRKGRMSGSRGWTRGKCRLFIFIKNHPLISFNLTNDIAYTIIIAVNSYRCNDYLKEV